MHRVFDGCEIHYFVAVNSSEVLGFTKILVTAHENYVDQIHVSPLASEAKLKLGWHLLNTIPTRIQQADLDKPVRLQVADRNTDAAGWYRAASFAAFGAQGEDGKWQPPPSSPWSELDEATKRYSGRWTSVKDLQEMTDPKCKLTPLKPEVHIRHFVVETSSGRRSGATDIPPPLAVDGQPYMLTPTLHTLCGRSRSSLSAPVATHRYRTPSQAAEQGAARDAAAAAQRAALDAAATAERAARDAAADTRRAGLDSAAATERAAAEVASATQRVATAAAAAAEVAAVDAARLAAEQRAARDAAADTQRAALDAAATAERAAAEVAAATQRDALDAAATARRGALDQAATDRRGWRDRAAAAGRYADDDRGDAAAAADHGRESESWETAKEVLAEHGGLELSNFKPAGTPENTHKVWGVRTIMSDEASARKRPAASVDKSMRMKAKVDIGDQEYACLMDLAVKILPGSASPSHNLAMGACAKQQMVLSKTVLSLLLLASSKINKRPRLWRAARSRSCAASSPRPIPRSRGCGLIQLGRRRPRSQH